MRKIFTLILVLFSIASNALDPSHFTITRISAPYFVVDGSSRATITQGYVGFEVKNNSNSGITYTGLRFSITSINTSVFGMDYAVIAPFGGIQNIGTLIPGQSKVVYFYVSYPPSITPQATVNVQLSDVSASPKVQSFIISNRSCVSANASGTATQTITNQDLIGGTITDDITYSVGNLQNANEADFQVAVSSQFDPRKLRLLSTQVIASNIPGYPVGTTDSLYCVTTNRINSASVTIRFVFRIGAYNFTTYFLPYGGSTSGSNYKYSLNTDLGTGTPVTVSPTANPLIITKTSDRSLYAPNTVAIFTITIQNPGAYPVTMDKISDQLPSGFTFLSFDPASQVISSNSTSVPRPGDFGAIAFEGDVTTPGNTSYIVPAGGTLILKYLARTSTSGSDLQTSVSNYVSTTVVGTSNNTVSVSTTLPVRFISFKGNRTNDAVKLDWVAANELNSKSFEIERSNGNGTFSKIGEVAAAGTFSSSTSYTFVDYAPQAGVNHYRLREVDLDSKAQYSSVISILPAGRDAQIIKAFPNPFNVYTNISITSSQEQTVRLILSDIAGKTIITRNEVCTKGQNTILLDQAAQLNEGTYLLQVITNEGIQQLKLIKGH
jgi:uncharacterized repeat protein (TIGR01451 family)